MIAHVLHYVACAHACPKSMCIFRSCFLQVRKGQPDTITYLPRASPCCCHAAEEACSISERGRPEALQARLLRQPQGVVGECARRAAPGDQEDGGQPLPFI